MGRPRWLLAIAVLAVAARFVLLVIPPPVGGDAQRRYLPVAENLLAGHGLSRSPQAPFVPDTYSVPVYPTFLAAVLGVSGGSHRAVIAVQILLELLTVLLAVRICRKLALGPVAETVTLLAGLLCPRLAIYAGLLLSEVLAALLLTLLVFLLLEARSSTGRRGAWLWAAAGITAAAACLTRPSSAVQAALAIAAILIASLRRERRVPGQVLWAAVAFVAAMAPWSMRNLQVAGAFLPLGRSADNLSTGYVSWLGTWLDHPKHHKPYWWRAFDSDGPLTFPEDRIPDAEERAQAAAILVGVREHRIPMDEAKRRFEELARRAWESRPLSVVTTPLRRVAFTWVGLPPVLAHPVWLFPPAWIAFLALALAGAVLAVRSLGAEALVLLSAPLARAILIGMTGIGAEHRYVLEALPLCFVLVGVAGQRALAHLHRAVVPTAPTSERM